MVNKKKGKKKKVTYQLDPWSSIYNFKQDSYWFERQNLLLQYILNLLLHKYAFIYILEIWPSLYNSWFDLIHVLENSTYDSWFDNIGQAPFSLDAWQGEPSLKGSFDKSLTLASKPHSSFGPGRSLGNVGVILNILSGECRDENIF